MWSESARRRYQIARLACDEQFIERVFAPNTKHVETTWTEKPVAVELLEEVYDLAKWCPSARNCSPLRVTYVVSPEAKEKLLRCCDGDADGKDSGTAELKSAPVVAILAMDLEFWKHFPQLGSDASAGQRYIDNPASAEPVASLNAKIMSGFFLMAARVLGLDVCPFRGRWDRAQVDESFHLHDPKHASWRAIMLCAMGYANKPEGAAPSPQASLPFDSGAIVYDCRPNDQERGSSLATPTAKPALPDDMADTPLEEDLVQDVYHNMVAYQSQVLFRTTRTHLGYYPVFYEPDFGASPQLEQMYKLAQRYPSLFDLTPLRIAFIFAPPAEVPNSSEAAEEKKDAASVNARRAYDIMMQSLAGGNVQSTKSAPLVAVLAADLDLASKLNGEDAKDADSSAIEADAMTGVAWFISAVRALGYDCGPMGGFNKETLSQMFLPKDGEAAEGDWRDKRTRGWKPFLLVKIGAGDHRKLRPRMPRLPCNLAIRML